MMSLFLKATFVPVRTLTSNFYDMTTIYFTDVYEFLCLN